MAPERSPKRVKTNPKEHDESVKQVVAPLIQLPGSQDIAVKESDSPLKPPDKHEQRSSWYTRTWPRKAPPVTQVARESISSATNLATESVVAVTPKSPPTPNSVRSGSLQATLGKSTPTRSMPAELTTTKIHATPESSLPQKKQSQKEIREVKESSSESTAKGTTMKAAAIAGATKQEDTTEESAALAARSTTTLGHLHGSSQDSRNVSSTWLGWFSPPDLPEQSAAANKETSKPAEPPQSSKPNATPEPAPPPEEIAAVPSANPEGKKDVNLTGSRLSWLPIWSNETNDRSNSAPPINRQPAPLETATKSGTTTSLLTPEPAQIETPSHSKASSIETSPPPPLPGDSSKSAGWVFWSRDRKTNKSEHSEDQAHIGEIAISGTPSQRLPRRASIIVERPDAVKSTEAKPKKESQERPQSPTPSVTDVKSPKAAKNKPATPAKGIQSAKSKSTAETTKAESSKAAAVSKPPEEVEPNLTESVAKKFAPNLLLPPFRETFVLQESPSIIQQIARLLKYTTAPEPKHLSLIRDPLRIKNALAIGVHGYFPAPLIQKVIGQPTGTSIKFADMAARSIRKWTKARGYECQVKTAALEGEGKISERLELLWKLLLNWIDEIRKADFVMVACHSQGVPVAVMLVAKLIHFGCVSSARVGICAMAGVNMGPFQDYKSRWISGSAGELFEFSDPNSRVSTDYLAALETVLKYGVRVSFIGSIDDQLVSLESSLYTPISHPHIYRAVQIDSRVHAPNFLSHLVGFALKLRNLGVPDHGLIRELSWPLAGSLYSGEGHSRIYEDDAVYDLAVAFALETNILNNVDLTQRPSLPGASNPYILPFAMRGILEEEFVKTELQDEAGELLKQFDEWRPATKALKDVKFRLEGIRSKM